MHHQQTADDDENGPGGHPPAESLLQHEAPEDGCSQVGDGREGEDQGDVRLYTLSSCVWCGKVKDLLGQLDVRYRFVDTPLLEEADDGNPFS